MEENKESQRVGRTSLLSVDENVKRSTDIPIAPLDLKDDKFHVFGTFVENFQCRYLDYLEQWELLKKFYPRLHIGPFNLQRYDAGGHFGAVHSDQ